MMLILIIGATTFTSCGDKCKCNGDCHGIQCSAPCADDCRCTMDNQHVSNPIVGTKWVAENGKYLYFKTQTAGIYYEGDSYDKGDPYEDFSYTFNSKDNTILLLFGDEYESAQYTTSYIILGSKKFYKDNVVSSIYGTWAFAEKEGSYSFSQTITFNADGTFKITWKEMDYSGEESGTWMYDTNDHKLTTNTIVGEKPGKYTYTVILSENKMTLVEEDGDVMGPYVKQ